MAFKKGQSGNPAGRPKGILHVKRTELTELLVNQVEKELPEIISTLTDLSKKGEVKAISLLFDYILVKPVSKHVINDHQGEDIQGKTKEELLTILNG